MERPLNPSASPTFMIGIAVIVIIAQLVTAGIENFWWHLAAMCLIALVLAWPLRLVLRASDRRFERKLEQDAARRE